MTKEQAFDWLVENLPHVALYGSEERGYWVCYHHPQGGFSNAGNGCTAFDAIVKARLYVAERRNALEKA